MTIDEAQQLKAELERNIRKLCMEYTEKTGMGIEEIYLEPLMEFPSHATITYLVTVTVKL